jgi:hypothetical protein
MEYGTFFNQIEDALSKQLRLASGKEWPLQTFLQCMEKRSVFSIL